MKADDSGNRRLFLLPKRLKFNERNKVDGLKLLAAIPDEKVKLAFFDPQYRAGLDKLAYGNEGARQKGRAALPQMGDDLIIRLIKEIDRVVVSSGHVALWVDKFTMGSGHHLKYIDPTPNLATVDLIHWNKLSFGMGKRTRGVSEYLIVLQKSPIRAKGIWTDHAIRDSWPEASDRDRHPHAKPHGLIERLIHAVTKSGDLVLDPCAGGYGVLDACRLSRREFLGGDLI